VERIVVPNGPLPFTFLEFYTERSYVTARIRPDGTFTAQLHSAVHQIDMAGMIPGYGLASAHAQWEAAGERDQRRHQLTCPASKSRWRRRRHLGACLAR
jgi:hypothetical protein